MEFSVETVKGHDVERLITQANPGQTTAVAYLMRVQPLFVSLQTGSPQLPPAPVIPSTNERLPEDFGFIILLFVLFVIPKALQRYRVPAAITSLVLGAVAANTGLVQGSLTLQMLSTFGIVALFLFAGLEIQAEELRRGARTLVQHVVLW